MLEIDFKDPKEFNYYHSTKKANVEAGAYYKVSGFIKAEGLVDDTGVGLEVQDGRGWNVSHSAVDTDTVRGTTDWQFVEAIYQALPDAKNVTVIVRRIGEKGPLQGKVYIKDVKFERFIPALDSTRIPYLSVNASKNKDGNKVYLMVVNKDQDKPQTATITLNGFEPASQGNAWVLNGPAIDATNEENHDNVKVTQKKFQVSSIKSQEKGSSPDTRHMTQDTGSPSSFTFTFEPHSLTAIELDKQSNR